MPFKLSKEPFVKSLVDSQFDIMIHGSNCQNAMGSGIAKVIKSNFKEAWLADCSKIKGDYKKLGKTTYANVVRGPSSFVVVNAYTQFKWIREKKLHCDYNAIRKSLAEVNATFPNGKILLPKID
ncbi:macro domain-containing protein [Photobacterium leiognathi]|uniref:phosphatase n=1 Tax=Photobacterium leiognathi TaxID=553611 RepID=UPI001EDF06B9|nr:phosphatase [Photobacterium leiognathi]MCG3883935.1 macro domain-containing protein [Photobacterium leiognathi]